MKKINYTLIAIIITLFLTGCQYSAPLEPSYSENTTLSFNNSSPQYNFFIKVTQTNGLSAYVVLSDTFRSNQAGWSPIEYFSTLNTPDGNSSFLIEYGAYWTNANADYGIQYISDLSDNIIFNYTTYLTLNGSYNHINNINLKEGKTYKYQMGAITWDEDR